jgi:MoaD family protein
MATVLIPAALRGMTGGQSKIIVEGASVGDVLERLAVLYPGVRALLFDEGGALRAHVNIFVNDAEIRQLAGLQTSLADADEVAIIPAMAGGAIH